MKKILLVEDDAGFRQMLSRLLERRGFAVEAEASGRSGLERARSSPPDIIVMDWMLGEKLQGKIVRR